MLAARSRQVLAAHGGDEGLRFDPSGMGTPWVSFSCAPRTTACDALPLDLQLRSVPCPAA